MTRIDDTFARLRAQGRKAFVAYMMGGDPDADVSLQVMRGLPGAGVVRPRVAPAKRAISAASLP